MPDHAATDWSKPGAPIAHVLNNEISMLHATQPSYMLQGTSAAPFSGKLVDLLLDPADEAFNKHRRLDEPNGESSMNVCENPVIKLPRPPQLPQKTAKRPRIPPLLQGLHQPPPLPAGRLFPPITDGVNAFERDISDRNESENVAEELRSKEVENTQHVSNKEETLNEVQTETAPEVNSSKARKRRKWTDEETKDLLVGVSKYGIGSWKKILQSPEFSFNGRTAVDLKDRFRICCPGEGLKPRQAKKKARTESHPEPTMDVASLPNLMDKPDTRKSSGVSSPKEKATTKSAGRPQHMGPSELAKLGIQAPFVRNPRRPRRAFSAEDDENLLKGFEKYGAVWHSMRDDPSLGFGNRHPTDLRDRFRIRYPESYAKAGYKTKPNINRSNSSDDKRKEEKSTGNKTHKRTETNSSVAIGDGQQPRKNHQPSDHDAPGSSSKPTSSMPFPFEMMGSAWLDDISHTNAFEAEEHGSPIILNRNILQWADSNSFAAPRSTPANAFSSIDIMNDMNNDGVHINPMATLKLPTMPLTSHIFAPSSSSVGARNKSAPTSNTLLGSPPTSSPTAMSSIPPDTISPPPSHNNSQQSHHSHHKSFSKNLLHTPNLPTIVFPHVPVASARNTLHNLPTPADLLSGMDLDGVELQMSGSGAGDGNTSMGGWNMGGISSS